MCVCERVRIIKKCEIHVVLECLKGRFNLFVNSCDDNYTGRGGRTYISENPSIFFLKQESRF